MYQTLLATVLIFSW